MLDSGPPSPRVPANWAEVPDEQLLALRLSDLPLTLDGTIVEGRIALLQGEPAARELQLPIHFHISNEWFTPDGTVAMAVPFYMTHPRLERAPPGARVDGRENANA